MMRVIKGGGEASSRRAYLRLVGDRDRPEPITRIVTVTIPGPKYPCLAKEINELQTWHTSMLSWLDKQPKGEWE